MKKVCANCRFARIDLRGEKPYFVCVKKGSVVTNIYTRKNCDDMRVDKALNMAIEALEQEPIIHCKNCKHWQEWENGTGACRRSMIWVGTDYDDYCSFAEQKESDAE